MCGIVGYIGENAPQNIIINGLSKLEYRGYDSAGIAIVDNGRFKVRKKAGKLNELRSYIGSERLGGHSGIGHTRWATHGAPTDENAHPHLSMDGKVAIVHNGTVENYVELKSQLIKDGYKDFKSETDTEVVAFLIGKYYNQTGDLKAAVDKATSEMTGTFVIVAITCDDPDTIVAFRKNAPLLAGLGSNCGFVASDFAALLEYTKDMHLIDNGDTVVLKKNSIEIYDSENNKVEREIMHVTWDAKAAEKEGYDHFMIKEINEQPTGIMETLSRNLDDAGRVSIEGINLTAEDLEAFDKVYIVACGTAYHAGLVGKYIIEKLARIPVEVDVASEFRYRDPLVDDKTLFIAISQSGETADTLEALRAAKARGARTLSIVNVIGSSVARESDEVFYTQAGPEISVASTKAYTTQMTCLYLLALYFADLRGTITAEEYDEFVEDLVAIPGKLTEVLELADDLEELASHYYDRDQIFFIGRGLDSAVSYEGSLKLKEISYINSFAIAAGELKHGTIALMEPRTIVIALATQDALFDKMVSNIQEVKARNAHIISFAKRGNTKIEEHSDETFYIPRCRDELTPLLAVVPLQLFAYYVAKCKGYDIDQPRNLAKSVTVE